MTIKMGLPLYQTSSDSVLLDSLTEPGSLGRRGRENPRAKHPHKPFSWGSDKLLKIEANYRQQLAREPWAEPELKKHHLAAFTAEVSHFRNRRGSHWSSTKLTRNRLGSHTRTRWTAADTDEGVALAHDDRVQLPCDRGRRRPPSLERQDAFRDESTSTSTRRNKKRSYRHITSSQSSNDSERDVEELYRLGLLYDNEHERGSGFSFDAIAHDEPLYRCNVRPAKRGRNSQTRKNHKQFPDEVLLPLNLSFAELREDEALAAFLISPSHSELLETSVVVEPVRGGSQVEVPLRVIYELEVEEDTYNSGEEEEEERDELEEDEQEKDDFWAMVDEDDISCCGEEDTAVAEGEHGGGDEDACQWVVLGIDGS
ncbi:hypothetical protein QBC46DRAFT_394870 [Diplogelasinospora grovesii]|uniref:Uncharacterized protein n=1 Tax=Diplogelasinospora grovesii TaxID=303347 RepID=A0AAN6MZP7_9PEZI|nr:hypothetical protein QBC46DRAFT_394870 [Diplogelasinospora grovesii]